MSTDRPRTRPKRDYSDAVKAKTLTALELNGGELRATSRQTQIPLATIAYWRNGNVTENVTNIHAQQKQELADRFEELAHLYITQAENTFEHSKGTQAIVGAATATDKMRLLRDQTTANIAHTDLLSELRQLVAASPQTAVISVAIFARKMSRNPLELAKQIGVEWEADDE